MSADAKARRIIALGSGGHARVIQEMLSLGGTRLDGFVGPSAESRLIDIEWLGDDDVLTTLDPDDVVFVNGIGSTRSSPQRELIYRRLADARFEFLTVIDPSATVRPSASIADGVLILAAAIVNTDAMIGENSIVNSGAIVEHDCIIGAHVHLSPGVALGGGVEIGARSHIGIGARVLQGVSIGSDCTIGAGAVVTRNIENGSVAVGVPAVVRPAP